MGSDEFSKRAVGINTEHHWVQIAVKLGMMKSKALLRSRTLKNDEVKGFIKIEDLKN